MPEQQPSQPPFRGGQCSTLYAVSYSYYRVNTPGTIYDVFARNFHGPITGHGNAIELVRPSYYGLFVHARDSQGNPARVFHEAFMTGPDPEYAAQFRIASFKVRRADEQPDTCGDPPALEDPNTNPYNPEPDNNCCTASAPF